MNDSKDKKTYDPPKIFDYGSVSDITEKQAAGPKMDGGVKNVDPGMKTSV